MQKNNLKRELFLKWEREQHEIDIIKAKISAMLSIFIKGKGRKKRAKNGK